MAPTSLVPGTWPCNSGCFIISAFPASGKSWLTLHSRGETLASFNVVDLDSTLIPKTHGQRMQDFKEAYIAEVKEVMAPNTVILVSTHEEIRSALVENGLKFALVFPLENLKEQWLGRMRSRNSAENLLTFVERNWSRMLKECENQGGCEHFILGEGEYLSDIIDNIISNDSG